MKTAVEMLFVDGDATIILMWHSPHELTIDGAEVAAKVWAANHLLPDPTSIAVLTLKEK